MVKARTAMRLPLAGLLIGAALLLALIVRTQLIQLSYVHSSHQAPAIQQSGPALTVVNADRPASTQAKATKTGSSVGIPVPAQPSAAPQTAPTLQIVPQSDPCSRTTKPAPECPVMAAP